MNLKPGQRDGNFDFILINVYTVLKVGRSSSDSQYHTTKGSAPVVLAENKVERDLGVFVF